MKIILSGGWGYGNLGDEAILRATVRILNKIYANPKILVLSFDPDLSHETLKNDSHNVTVVRNLDSYISDLEKLRFSASGISPLKKVWLKLFEYIASSNLYVQRKYKSLANIQKHIDASFYKCFEDADLYLMSGGGYINDWTVCLLSRCLEVNIANQYGLKSFSIGQTIGVFNSHLHYGIARDMFSKIGYSVFRDIDSISDGRDMRINVCKNVIPDLALYENYTSEKKKNICIIPFNYDFISNIEEIKHSIQRILLETDYTITVVTTQNWAYTKRIAKKIYESIKYGDRVLLETPTTLAELENIIYKSKFVFSQNLHGLILGYRVGCHVISLNDKRKFKTFMHIVGLDSFILDLNNVTKDSFINCIKNKEWDSYKHILFDDEIMSDLSFLKFKN